MNQQDFRQRQNHLILIRLAGALSKLSLTSTLCPELSSRRENDVQRQDTIYLLLGCESETSVKMDVGNQLRDVSGRLVREPRSSVVCLEVFYLERD